jgi:GT2 family glycosyltransferase
VPDHNRYADRTGFIRRENFINRTRTFLSLPIPPLSVFVHGPPLSDADAFVRRLHGSGYAPSHIFWAVPGPAPAGVARTVESDVIAAARAQTEVRGDRMIAFVDTRTELEANWALELLDAVEFAQDIAAATVAEVESDDAPLSADARCTLVALRNIPQHLRLEAGFDSLDGAVADWIGRAVALGRSVRRTYRPTARIGAAGTDDAFQKRHGRSVAGFIAPDTARLEDLSRLRATEPVFASIVMLSWNAPEYTELAVASIRTYTQTPHEIIIIDNGSDEATRRRIAALPGDVRVIYNASNMGFAHGCNQGMAAARGTHVVLLNNDVVVTEGWLEALIDAQRRDPTIGISAPRSNFVAGDQQVHDANYANVEAMHEFAAQRRASLRGRTYYSDRVIGFCMCIARPVIEEVGGIDTRYGVGNFEDDDYCIRVRAAGYQMVVCEDAFIHHFGSVTFKANNVDYGARMRANWLTFAGRWDMPREFPTAGYQSRPVIARGFTRAQHYFPLPPGEETPVVVAEQTRDYELVLFAIVANEGDWTKVAPVVINFVRAYTSEDRVVFAIAATNGLHASTLGHRVERACIKAGLDPQLVPDVDISDVDDPAAWRASFSGARRYECAALTDRSRSGLARLLRMHLSA